MLLHTMYITILIIIVIITEFAWIIPKCTFRSLKSNVDSDALVLPFPGINLFRLLTPNKYVHLRSVCLCIIIIVMI